MADAPTVARDASLYLHPQTLARLKSFELRAKMIVEGVMSGMHRSPYQGFSIEFAQHRPYATGDDIRRLDWKVYARTDKLQIKQYQQETNLDLVLMVDNSGSMGFGSLPFEQASGQGSTSGSGGRQTWAKFDHATAMAAAMAYITLHQGDRVGLVTFADEITGMVDRSGQRSTWRPIVETLSTRTLDRPTDCGRVIDQTLAKVTNRCLFVIISDLFEDADRVRSALARIRHRRHDAIVFQLLDESEQEFRFDQPTVFEGLEGEPKVRINPRAIREGYLEVLHEHIQAIERAALSFGFDYQLVTSGQWLGPTLAQFVAQRNAKIKRGKMG
ncbi:MAG TPA: DUF58 domain-containing protein [Phycisphaerales bacterium]|nr:DUF58 domain-containing protein [Phycisphaerales bacterium]